MAVGWHGTLSVYVRTPKRCNVVSYDVLTASGGQQARVFRPRELLPSVNASWLLHRPHSACVMRGLMIAKAVERFVASRSANELAEKSMPSASFVTRV